MQLMGYDYRILVGSEWPMFKILCTMSFKRNTNTDCDWKCDPPESDNCEPLMVAGYPANFIKETIGRFAGF